jgi:rubrerythrin
MNETIRILFESAIMQERASQKLYLKMAEQAAADVIKRFFTDLVEEEKQHERILSGFDIENLKMSNRAQLEKLKALVGVSRSRLYPVEVKDVNEALDFSIKEEQKQRDQYVMMVSHLDFGDSREVFEELARQEVRHKNALLKLKLEFNENDWHSLKIS